ncbi:MAG TPA: flagellar biosynthetic protein FliO [Rhodocyclaceae bacterium]|nr:flagellar biosynthetic protein FliO [Rhodocyclaceae bacterium]
MRPIPFLACVPFIAALYSPLLLAAPEAPADPSGISAGTYIQTFFGLLLIVALIAGMAWYARKLSGGQPFGRHLMRVVGGVSLGPRERIVLVEIGEQWLVIGLVPGQIRTLATLPKGELPPGQSSEGEKPFASWLKQMIEQRKNHA